LSLISCGLKTTTTSRCFPATFRWFARRERSAVGQLHLGKMRNARNVSGGFGKQSQVIGGRTAVTYRSSPSRFSATRPGVEDQRQLLGLAGQLPQAFRTGLRNSAKVSYPSGPLHTEHGQGQLLTDRLQRQTHLAQIVPALLVFPR